MLTVPQTAALLRTFDNILILTHVRPDGATVGCAAALCAGLRSLGKADAEAPFYCMVLWPLTTIPLLSPLAERISSGRKPPRAES